MMKIKCLGVLFVVLVLALPVQVLAEGEKEDYGTYTLGEIVVSAEKPVVRQIAVNTELTPQEIEATNARTVAEAVQYVPGIQVTTGRKNQPSISIHGFDQNKALMLIDGVPYYETKYGMFDLNQISTDSVARIDVVKGAASVLYGANAEAGVINIITKTATEKPSFDGKLELGQNGANAISLSHGMKTGNVNYWVSYMHRQWDSWKLSDDFEPREGVITTFAPKKNISNAIIQGQGDRINSDYKSDNIYVKLGLEQSNDFEYYLNLHYVKTEKGDPPSVSSVNNYILPRPAFTQFDRISNYNDWGADLSGKTKFTDKLGLTTKFFYHHHFDDYDSYTDETYSTKIASSRYKDYMLGGILIGDYNILDWNTLRLALNYRKDNHQQRDDEYLPFAESASYTGSTGLEDEMLFLDSRLSFVSGVGYDWFKVTEAKQTNTDSKTGAFINQTDNLIPETMKEFNPMGGVSYKIDDTAKLFASVAKKTRFPTLNELYASAKSGGNPSLKSEKSINITIGASKAFGNFLYLEVSPFYHDISDRISRDLPAPDSLYHNSAKIKMKGFELDADVNPMESLSFKLGYTYNHAEDVSPGQVTDKVTNAPSQELNGQAKYIVSRWETRINLNAVYYGKSYGQLPTAQKPANPIIENQRYTIFGAKITQPFLEKWKAYLSVNNLFDKNYEPQSGYPAQGRNVWVGVTYHY